MVDPDSDWVPRAPSYSGTASWRALHFAYGAVTLSGGAFQLLPLCTALLTPRVIPKRPYNPAFRRFGLLPFRSPLLGESLLISFPGLLRWFTSPGFAPPRYFIHARGTCLAACGLPHSDIRGSKDVCSSPRLFAACCVLLRLAAPQASAMDLYFTWPYHPSPREAFPGLSFSQLASPSLVPVKHHSFWRLGDLNP